MSDGLFETESDDALAKLAYLFGDSIGYQTTSCSQKGKCGSTWSGMFTYSSPRCRDHMDYATFNPPQSHET